MVTKKKQPAKKSTAKARSAKKPAFKSFRLCKESGQFVTFRLTKQTLYWAVLLIYVLFLDVWISNAQMSAMILLV